MLVFPAVVSSTSQQPALCSLPGAFALATCFSPRNSFVRTLPLLFSFHTALLCLTCNGSFVFKELGEQTTSCFPSLLKIHLDNLKPLRWWQYVLRSSGGGFKLIIETWGGWWLWFSQLAFLSHSPVATNAWAQLHNEGLPSRSPGCTNSLRPRLSAAPLRPSSSRPVPIPPFCRASRQLASPNQSLCALAESDRPGDVFFGQQRATTALALKSGNSLFHLSLFQELPVVTAILEMLSGFWW